MLTAKQDFAAQSIVSAAKNYRAVTKFLLSCIYTAAHSITQYSGGYFFGSNHLQAKNTKPGRTLLLMTHNTKKTGSYVHTNVLLNVAENVLTPPCLRMEVGSSNKSSLMHALHFCGPELKERKNK